MNSLWLKMLSKTVSFSDKKIICKQKIFVEASQKQQSFLLNLVKRLHFEVKNNYIKMEYFSKYLKELFYKYKKLFY